MTRDELKEKILCVLDDNDIGRKEIGYQPRHFGSWWVTLGEFEIRFNKDDINIKGFGYPTYTHKELFPDLEWVSDLNWDFADTDLICFEAEMLPPGELYLSNWDDRKRFTLKCHSGKLAKDMAQLIADQLDKSERLRKRNK